MTGTDKEKEAAAAKFAQINAAYEALCFQGFDGIEGCPCFPQSRVGKDSGNWVFQHVGSHYVLLWEWFQGHVCGLSWVDGLSQKKREHHLFTLLGGVRPLGKYAPLSEFVDALHLQ